MDDIAARDSIFEKRVAHGYFVLSAAAGLFVDPGARPGARELRSRESLRFVKPVYPGRHDPGDADREAEDGEGEEGGSGAAGRRGLGRRGEEPE